MRKSFNLVSFCDSIEFSNNAIDLVKNCKSSSFISPLHQFDYLISNDKHRIFHSKYSKIQSQQYKWIYDDYIRNSYDNNETFEFNINNTYNQDKVSIYEMFVYHLVEIFNWTYKHTKEYPSEISFSLDINLSIYGRRFIHDSLLLLNETQWAKENKVNVKLNGIFSTGLSAITNQIIDNNVTEEYYNIVYDIGFSKTTGYLVRVEPLKGKNSYDKDKVVNINIKVEDY